MCVHACMFLVKEHCTAVLYVCTNGVLEVIWSVGTLARVLFIIAHMQRKPAAGAVPVSNVSGW